MVFEKSDISTEGVSLLASIKLRFRNYYAFIFTCFDAPSKIELN